MTNNSQTFFDYAKWDAQLNDLNKKFRSADPFPHIAIDNFIEASYAKKVMAEYPSPNSSSWTHYKHFNENKQAQTKRALIPENAGRLIDEFNSPKFTEFLSKMTGIPGLLPDPGLEGGGMHQVEPGGFLNIHADFNSHPYNKRWTRRINLLLYFNENWQDSYGGHLEFWDKKQKKCGAKILPILARAVMFETNTDSFHGHPEPLRCPPGQTRKSIALYYFTEGEKNATVRATSYISRPVDSLAKRVVIRLDNWSLRAFDKMKRTFGVSDVFAGKILKRIFK